LTKNKTTTQLCKRALAFVDEWVSDLSGSSIIVNYFSPITAIDTTHNAAPVPIATPGPPNSRR
jgi:hypothetical protein